MCALDTNRVFRTDTFFEDNLSRKRLGCREIRINLHEKGWKEKFRNHYLGHMFGVFTKAGDIFDHY